MRAELTPQLLQRVVVRVLEEAAFVLAEPAPRPPPFEGDVVTATLPFSRPCVGFLRLTAPPECCTAMAANMLGVDPDDPEAAAQGFDALGELANIQCGAILAEIFGRDADILMKLPEVTVGPADIQDSVQPTDTRIALLTDDDWRVDVMVRVAHWTTSSRLPGRMP